MAGIAAFLLATAIGCGGGSGRPGTPGCGREQLSSAPQFTPEARESMHQSHTSGLSFSSQPVRSYGTRFAVSESPISEGGIWLNGAADGLDWYDVIMEDGIACGTVTTGAYTDPTALLKGTWGRNQVATATVYSQHQTEKYYQEVEIRLRSALSAHVCTGYEVFWRCLQTKDAYAEIVRWNGKVGDWTSLRKNSGPQFGVKDGDVVEASIMGNVIKGYVNGVEVISAVDDTWSSGSPGIGFNYGVGDTNRDFGFRCFKVDTYDE
jgi:hypothetical protein